MQYAQAIFPYKKGKFDTNTPTGRIAREHEDHHL